MTHGQYPAVELQKLLASDGDDTDSFGYAVAMDGDYAVVGAPLDNNGNGSNAGAAYVFKYDGMSWSQQAKLTASDGESSDQITTSFL